MARWTDRRLRSEGVPGRTRNTDLFESRRQVREHRGVARVVGNVGQLGGIRRQVIELEVAWLEGRIVSVERIASGPEPAVAWDEVVHPGWVIGPEECLV